MKFNLVTVHAGELYRECISSCQYGLESLGHSVIVTDNYIAPDAVNIIFGAHYQRCGPLTSWIDLSEQGVQFIIYNLEPATPDQAKITQKYIRLLRNAHVWDYGEKNAQSFKNAAGLTDIHYVPICYAPSMSCINKPDFQDIDVLFYGNLNFPRRRHVIDGIRALGLNVMTADLSQPWLLGDERDKLISRSKVLLNIHALDSPHVFESARVSYWLANKKAIVTEVSPLTDIDERLKGAMACGTLDELPKLCFDLVHDENKRIALEQKSFEIFQTFDATDTMQKALDLYIKSIGSSHSINADLPNILQLGSSGEAGFVADRWNFSFCNIDDNPDFSPDITLDISEPLDYSTPVDSWRFGKVQLKPDMFKTIIAKNVFQRVNNLKQALSNCLELLDDGGKMEITVPLNLSNLAWSHVDDKRTFTTSSWEHLVKNWWQYGWQTHRFVITNTSYVVNNGFGLSFLAEHNNDWGLALRTPGAIDYIVLSLQKRPLTNTEKLEIASKQFIG